MTQRQQRNWINRIFCFLACFAGTVAAHTLVLLVDSI